MKSGIIDAPLSIRSERGFEEADVWTTMNGKNFLSGFVVNSHVLIFCFSFSDLAFIEESSDLFLETLFAREDLDWRLLRAWG